MAECWDINLINIGERMGDDYLRGERAASQARLGALVGLDYTAVGPRSDILIGWTKSNRSRTDSLGGNEANESGVGPAKLLIQCRPEGQIENLSTPPSGGSRPRPVAKRLFPLALARRSRATGL